MSEERAKYVVPRRNDGECSNAHKAASFLWAVGRHAANSATLGFAVVGFAVVWTLMIGGLDGMTFAVGDSAFAAGRLAKLGAIGSIIGLFISLVLDPPHLLWKGEER